jgi:predicted acetyltransferase
MTYAQFKQNRGIIGSVNLRKMTYAQFKQNRGIIGSVNLRKMTYAQLKQNRGIIGSDIYATDHHRHHRQLKPE